MYQCPVALASEGAGGQIRGPRGGDNSTVSSATQSPAFSRSSFSPRFSCTTLLICWHLVFQNFSPATCLVECGVNRVGFRPAVSSWLLSVSGCVSKFRRLLSVVHRLRRSFIIVMIKSVCPTRTPLPQGRTLPR